MPREGLEQSRHVAEFYVYPEDVKALANELRGRVEVAWGLEVMSYGMREFRIEDLNGYYIAFTELAGGDG